MAEEKVGFFKRLVNGLTKKMCIRDSYKSSREAAKDGV